MPSPARVSRHRRQDPPQRDDDAERGHLHRGGGHRQRRRQAAAVPDGQRAVRGLEPQECAAGSQRRPALVPPGGDGGARCPQGDGRRASDAAGRRDARGGSTAPTAQPSRRGHTRPATSPMVAAPSGSPTATSSGHQGAVRAPPTASSPKSSAGNWPRAPQRRGRRTAADQRRRRRHQPVRAAVPPSAAHADLTRERSWT